MSETVKQVTDSTFDAEVLKSNIPVLVDFLGRVVWPLPNGRAGGRGSVQTV